MRLNCGIPHCECTCKDCYAASERMCTKGYHNFVIVGYSHGFPKKVCSYCQSKFGLMLNGEFI